LQPVELLVPGRTDLPSWGAVVTVWEDRRAPVRWPDGRGTAVIDADALRGPLVVRPRRRGDRITPLGMTGSRSVADVLGEAKLSRAERDRVPIVAAGRDAADVVWIAGHRVSDTFKVRTGTKRYLWMAFEGGPPWRS
jgi:tRNA(Ile)-lysidine synthase